ncbi:MAG TPA: hypothetical protein VMA98_09355 [Candidatus Acidoferrales bacterium]|nr:hypothetical protein [Candidatus Acidoferrales bacterium]
MAITLTEPAESAGSSLSPAQPDVAIAAVIDALYATRSARSISVDATLTKFAYPALRYAHDRGIRIHLLTRRQRYCDASPALVRLGIDVDAWPAPPAGLFVVEERMVYLRSQSSMTIAHEFAHGLDCALGNGVYRSGIDPEQRRLFAEARNFVTPYQATGIDEFWAEAVRAFVECNDHSSHWPKATRSRLQRLQPEMYSYVERILNVEIPQHVRRDVKKG